MNSARFPPGGLIWLDSNVVQPWLAVSSMRVMSDTATVALPDGNCA